jgi:VWFA-related protein
MFRRARIVALGLVVAQAALGGQSAPSTSQGTSETAPRATAPQTPLTFRSAIELIDVDIFVTDSDGRFVRDLTQDDFEILEDGKPQPIHTFSFVDLPFERADAAPVESTDVPEPDVVTNDTEPGRVYVILMDSPSTSPPGGLRQSGTYDAYAKTFARQFVEEAVAPGDIAAVVHVQGTFTDSQAFTANRLLVLKAIDRYGLGRSGAADRDTLGGPEMVARNMATYRAIQDLSERLGAVSGRRKAILWLGGQIVFEPSSEPCPDPDPTQLCAIPRSAGPLLAAYRAALRAATRNNVAIYPVDPSGMTTELGLKELSRTGALRQMAEDTGGLAVVGTNNFAGGYQAIVRDSSTYYVVGYSPATEHRDGKFHDVRVRVKRPGLTVRARKGYFAPEPDARAPARPTLPAGVSMARG